MRACGAWAARGNDRETCNVEQRVRPTPRRAGRASFFSLHFLGLLFGVRAKLSPRECSIVPRYPSGVLQTERLLIYYPHAIGAKVQAPCSPPAVVTNSWPATASINHPRLLVALSCGVAVGLPRPPHLASRVWSSPTHAPCYIPAAHSRPVLQPPVLLRHPKIVPPLARAAPPHPPRVRDPSAPSALLLSHSDPSP